MTQIHTKRVAAAVRAEMARRNVTQQMLADQLGMTQAAVSRRLVGRVPFDAEELGRVAEYLGVPVSLLFGETAA
jgi:predicted transcriptional regulator